MRTQKTRPKPAAPPGQSPVPYRYPLCVCGTRTALTALRGWQCPACKASYPFRDDYGRTIDALQLTSAETEQAV